MAWAVSEILTGKFFTGRGPASGLQISKSSNADNDNLNEVVQPYLVVLLKVLLHEDDILTGQVTKNVDLLEDVVPAVSKARL